MARRGRGCRISNLESPADDLLHLIVGAWARYAAFMGRATMRATA
ncbi:MAG TPA: hypothetical protein VI056_10365 [Candidatus Limnocylindria bacterium]